MTPFNFDAVVHEAKRTPFEFEAGGTQWRVPHVADLTIGQQIALDSGQTHRVMREVAEVYDITETSAEWKPAGRKGAELILGKHPDQVAAFQAAWLAHAGVAPGESPASSR